MNRQTRALSKRGLSVKFRHGVNPHQTATRSDPNPEIVLVDKPDSRGVKVNSSKERKESGRKPYNAPTQKVHPVSGEPPRPTFAGVRILPRLAKAA